MKVIEFKKNNQAFTNVCHELTAKKIPHTPGVMHHFDYNEYSIVIETKDEEVFGKGYKNTAYPIVTI